MSGAGFSINAKLVGKLKAALDVFVTTYANAASGSWLSPAAWSASLDRSGHHAPQTELFRNLQAALNTSAASYDLRAQFFKLVAAFVLVGKLHTKVTGTAVDSGTSFAPAYKTLAEAFSEHLVSVLTDKINTQLTDASLASAIPDVKNPIASQFLALLEGLESVCWTAEAQAKFASDCTGDALFLLKTGSAVADGRAAPEGATPLAEVVCQNTKSPDMKALCRAVAAGISGGIPRGLNLAFVPGQLTVKHLASPHAPVICDLFLDGDTLSFLRNLGSAVPARFADSERSRSRVEIVEDKGTAASVITEVTPQGQASVALVNLDPWQRVINQFLGPCLLVVDESQEGALALTASSSPLVFTPVRRKFLLDVALTVTPANSPVDTPMAAVGAAAAAPFVAEAAASGAKKPKAPKEKVTAQQADLMLRAALKAAEAAKVRKAGEKTVVLTRQEQKELQDFLEQNRPSRVSKILKSDRRMPEPRAVKLAETQLEKEFLAQLAARKSSGCAARR